MPLRWKVLFALMAGSGSRIGEAFRLEIEDLDLSGRTHPPPAPWNLEGQDIRAKDDARDVNCVYRAHSRFNALFVSRGKNFGNSVSSR